MQRCQMWSQSGSDWHQMGRILDLWRSFFSTFCLAKPKSTEQLFSKFDWCEGETNYRNLVFVKVIWFFQIHSQSSQKIICLCFTYAWQYIFMFTCVRIICMCESTSDSWHDLQLKVFIFWQSILSILIIWLSKIKHLPFSTFLKDFSLRAMMKKQKEIRIWFYFIQTNSFNKTKNKSVQVFIYAWLSLRLSRRLIMALQVWN